MDQEENNEQNSERSSGQGSKRKTRGPTTCKKLKDNIANQKLKCSIDFDQYGDPIGDMADSFRSYIGSVVRLRVNINIESWDAVSDRLKETIWEDVKGNWNLEDDLRKKQVLQSASKMWRDFKSKLVSNFLRKGRNPSETYSFISEQKWEIFKKTRETEDFKKKSDQARENQERNVHPHYLGKKGYAGKRPKWHKDDPLSSINSSESTDPSVISNERRGRGFDWVRARTKEREGGGYCIPNEHTNEVFQKMEEWQKRISDGIWTPQGHDDVLTRALGTKEHGGRVRGVGGKAKIKAVFGSENNKNSGVVSGHELDAITERVKQECQEMMNVKLQGLFEHWKKMGLPIPNGSFGFEEISSPKENVVRSSCQSVDRPDHLSEIKMPTLCRLCVIHSDKGRIIVARGQIFPSSYPEADFIHGKLIAPNNVKVCVDDVEKEFQLTPLPVPTGEHGTVGDAIGTFVQWPKDLVILGQEPENEKGHNITTPTVPRKQNNIVSKESATPIRKNEAFPGGDKNLSEKCRSLRFVVNNLPRGRTTEVVKNKEVFKYHKNIEDPIFVARQDVDEFLRMSCLNVSIVQIFMMYIDKVCKDSKDDSFAFMCPSILSLVSESKYQESISRYLSKVMKYAKEKRFVLAPYNQDNHWMLLLFCVEESAVYVFDSLKQKRDLRLKSPWTAAYKIYVAYGGRKNQQANLVWYHQDVQCPQQEGGTECGYYVMRYMYDIVRLSRKVLDTNWKEGLGTRSYTHEQINEIRDLWADYFTVECI